MVNIVHIKGKTFDGKPASVSAEATPNEVEVLKGKLEELEATHSSLLDSYIKDAEYFKKIKADHDKMEAEFGNLKADSHRLYTEALPMMSLAMMCVNKLNRDIQKWASNSDAPVPHMPIDPFMRKTFEALESEIADLLKKVKGDLEKEQES